MIGKSMPSVYCIPLLLPMSQKDRVIQTWINELQHNQPGETGLLANGYPDYLIMSG